MVEELRTECEGLVVLATSRAALGAAGEQVVAVGPLEIGSGETYGEAERLFIDRAVRTAPTFEPPPASELRELCRLLDGLPLAIELASAHADALSVADIRRGLEEQADVLFSGRGHSGRHSSVE